MCRVNKKERHFFNQTYAHIFNFFNNIYILNFYLIFGHQVQTLLTGVPRKFRFRHKGSIDNRT